ncbi:MAG: response regulator [Desulfobacteraceae bacterium]|nr:MAG: response regulator [Desulfobacteraceae bacterium]
MPPQDLPNQSPHHFKSLGGFAVVKSILVADDDYDYQLLIRLALEAAGFKGSLEMVGHGTELMDYLHNRGQYSRSRAPDLIILDLDMPCKDGREALKEIKADRKLKSIPIVLLSISGPEEDRKLCHDFECTFLQKPESYAQWVNAMESILKFYGVEEPENGGKDFFQELLP